MSIRDLQIFRNGLSGIPKINFFKLTQKHIIILVTLVFVVLEVCGNRCRPRIHPGNPQSAHELSILSNLRIRSCEIDNQILFCLRISSNN